MITCSIGISYIDFSTLDEFKNLEEVYKILLNQSDKVLYKAKENGRNRVEIYKPELA